MTLAIAFRKFAEERMVTSWTRLTTYATLLLLKSIREVSDSFEIYRAEIWRCSPDLADFRPDKYVLETLDPKQLEEVLYGTSLEKVFS